MHIAQDPKPNSLLDHFDAKETVSAVIIESDPDSALI